MRRFLGILLVLAIVSVPLLFLFGGPARQAAPTGPQVALIDIAGTIVDGATIGNTNPRTTVGHLRSAQRDPRIAAVVVRINSGGGSPAASEEIYDEIVRTRAMGKPVVISMGDVAASGGYYIAAAGDKILANPSTTTGSIGVIMQYVVLEQLLNDLGIAAETITSGRFKDTGNPFRPLEPFERDYLEEMVNDVLEQFIKAVAEGRGLDVDYVRELADGRIFTGRQAHELGLVDELGGLEDALLTAGAMVGIEGRPPVVTLERRLSFVERLLQIMQRALPPETMLDWLNMPPWGYNLR